MDLAAVLLSFASLLFATFLGRGYVYYGLVLSAYLVFGLIALFSLFCALLSHWPKALRLHLAPVCAGAARLVFVCCFSFLCLVRSNALSPNTYLRDYDRAQMPQYQFAEYMHETCENPTLLNLGFLDGGFFFAADILPTFRFFCTFNVGAPNMWDDQCACVEAGGVDFVITRDHTLEDFGIGAKYELVKTASMFFESSVCDYYLYALKDTVSAM